LRVLVAKRWSDVATVAKTTELKKEALWGMKKAKNHHVIFGKVVSREPLIPFSATLRWRTRHVVVGPLHCDL